MRADVSVRRLAAWTAAFALALAGGVAYLVWQTDLAWWLGSAAALPLVFLAVSRDSNGSRDDREHFTGGDAGPWGPP